MIYLAGPFIAFGDFRPLENHIIREILILLLVAGAASFGGFQFYRRRKGAQQIADGISGADQPVSDEPVLKERMKDALATLKTSSGNKSGLSLRSALVRHHRAAGRRQDHGAGQFRAEVSAGAGRHAGGDRRRWRHALLRLVVYRRGRTDRHRRALHHPGFRTARPTRRAGSPSSTC